VDWLDQVVENVTSAQPEGKLIVSSGHSPSGTYHIGTLREIMTANAIAWALRRAGRDAEHWDVVDDYDALRKVPVGIGVPESWAKYVGVPLRLVPDPFECHPSYGAHYLEQLNSGLLQLGITPDRQLSGYDNYQSGALIDQSIQVLDHLDEVRSILVEVGKRELEDNWSPVQILDDENNLRSRKFVSWNKETHTILWRDKQGQTGELGLDSGKVTLGWRLDWPARWAKWGISVEPFGRDHATKGGSYDTGKVLVERIFGGHAPYPVPYEFINPAGETKKMSKSAGNVLTPADALEVMPPEILRYFVINSRPSRTLTFDSGLRAGNYSYGLCT
jgi:lysyl-tRNA synthetase class 1